MGRSTKAQAAADSGGPPPDNSKMLAELRAEESGHRERAAKLLEEKKAPGAPFVDHPADILPRRFVLWVRREHAGIDGFSRRHGNSYKH